MAFTDGGVQINPAEEVIPFGKLGIRFLMTGAETRGAVAAFELTVPPDTLPGPPAHKHDAFDETVYGVEGSMRWTVDGVEMNVATGQALCIPRGAVHRFDNPYQAPAKVLCIATPGVLDPGCFREIGAAVAAAGTGQLDRERLREIVARHGFTVVTP